MRSKERAEMRTPLPKAITPATRRCGTRDMKPAAAPSSSADPARSPHNPARNQTGNTCHPLARPVLNSDPSLRRLVEQLLDHLLERGGLVLVRADGEDA